MKASSFKKKLRAEDDTVVNDDFYEKRLRDSPVASSTTRDARATVEALSPKTRKAVTDTLKRFKKHGLHDNYVTK